MGIKSTGPVGVLGCTGCGREEACTQHKSRGSAWITPQKHPNSNGPSVLCSASWSDRRRKADRVLLIPPLKNCPGLYFSPSKCLQSFGWEMALEIASVWGWGVFLLSGGNCGLLPGPRDGGGQKRYFILGCSLTASSENYIAPLSSSCIDHAWTSRFPGHFLFLF